VNTGLVVVGRIGDDLRMDYTAQGDTTNLAARLQQMAPAGAIWVGEATYRIAREVFEWQEVGRQAVKGKVDAVPVYALHGLLLGRSRFEVVAQRGLTRFVGRYLELQQLLAAWEQTEQGTGRVVSVVGEAGIGKSRLLYEFKQWLMPLDIPATVQGVLLARIDRLREDLKAVHQVASVIGRVFSQPLLTYVLQQCPELEKSLLQAVEYLDLANQKASRANAMEEAKRYFDDAMMLLDTLPETERNQYRRIALLVNQQTVMFLLFKYPEYYDLLTRYEAVAIRVGDQGLLGAFYARLGWGEYGFGYFNQAIQTLAKAAERCEAVRNTEDAGLAYVVWEWSHMWKGDYDQRRSGAGARIWRAECPERSNAGRQIVGSESPWMGLWPGWRAPQRDRTPGRGSCA
jgi:hypothetical protein